MFVLADRATPNFHAFNNQLVPKNQINTRVSTNTQQAPLEPEITLQQRSMKDDE